MTDHFVKLSCGNCGGELDVYDDMEQFACGHCGTEMTAQRRGGTIVLKLAAEATKKVPSGGTDKTAAELAVMRLKEEAETLSKRSDAMLKASVERKKAGFIVGFSLILLGFIIVRMGFGLVLGLSLLAAGIFTTSYIRRSDKKVLADVRELNAKIDVLNGRIQDRAYQSSS